MPEGIQEAPSPHLREEGYCRSEFGKMMYENAIFSHLVPLLEVPFPVSEDLMSLSYSCRYIS